MNNTVSVIFARGGSKGIKKKNLQPLAGVPLLEHSIIHSMKNELITRTFVSSDDHEILDYAGSLGVDVIERPSNLAADDSPEWDSWKHAVIEIKKTVGEFDALVSLPTTAPLRTNDDITNCIKVFYGEKCDSVVTICKSSRNPYFNMVVLDKNGFIQKCFEPDAAINRRQDAPEVFDITTVCYISSPQFVLEKENIFAGETKYVEVPKARSIDIDEPLDLKIAECLYLMGNSENA